ncbi:DMT family transporter [Paenibacillus sp. J5C_2022]|uniref:DMT family transporter n=1 Tax=Paenibacillus sp. J5C2022 TaxID=2977129 RepID=UPI0021D296C5|nr:DMT family transporter [Paenibacillus sp. J5C2022]MCU6712957.1 DMT family transporter [Paenibacillus sp. J5C2022]
MWLMYAILAAVSFGMRGISYHWTSQQGFDRNLLLCGVFAMGAVVNLIAAIATGSAWNAASLVGIQMGLFSFGGNAGMFKGFAVGKASLVAILTALPSVVVVIVAFLLWGEKLHTMQLIAFLIIIGGVLLVRYSNELSLRNLQGAQWGLLAMLMFAFNDLSGKWSTMIGAELFPSMFFLFTTGTACFGLWWLFDLRKSRMQTEELAAASEISAPPASTNQPVVRKSRARLRTFLVGMAVGTTNTVGMFFIITAFDLGKAGLVSAVAALNVIIILIYTRFVVKESFSRTELTGIILAFAGIVVMRLFGT